MKFNRTSTFSLGLEMTDTTNSYKTKRVPNQIKALKLTKKYLLISNFNPKYSKNKKNRAQKNIKNRQIATN